MQINLGVLSTYFRKNGYPANTTVDLDYPELLAFKPGDDDSSSLTVFLDFADIKAIMQGHNVYNTITQIKDGFEARRVAGERPDIDKEIDDAIYNTLSKYIIEMLNAASATRIFPEISPLAKHVPIYFK